MVFIFIILSLVITYLFYKNTNPEISKAKKLILSILRFIAITSIILLLFNPIIKIKKKKIIKKRNIVLNDVSQSMNLKFSNKKKSDYFTNVLNILKKNNFNIINFANGINGDKNSTDLLKTITNLKELYPANTIKNIILLSDGWFENMNFDFLKKLPYPIYTIYPSIKEKGVNIAVKSIKFNKLNYTEEETPIQIELISQNYKDKAKLDLFINKQLFKSEMINFKNSNSQKITFYKNFKKEGIYTLTAKISTQNQINEITLEDNKKTEAINVLKSKKQILVISDILNWDLKFIIRALKKDKHLKIANLVYKRQFFKGRKVIKFSNQFKELSGLIIVNYGKLHFNSEQTKIIETYLKNGGALLYIGKPILSYLPVKGYSFEAEEKYSIQLTDLSQDFVTFNFDPEEIPPLDCIYVNPKSNGKILAIFDNPEKSPAIIFEKYYNGKIAYFSFFGLWRWQMWNKDNIYDKFILNLFSWLSNGVQKRFKLMLDKNGFSLGENINIKLLAFDEKLSPLRNLNLKIVLKDQNSDKVTKSFMIENDEGYYFQTKIYKAGKYKIEIFKDNKKVATGKFLVFNSTPENYHRGFNKINLKYIANLTGGQSFYIDDFDKNNFLSLLKEGKDKLIIDTYKEIPLYKNLFFVFTFIFAFVLELYLRKLWGLL